MSFVNQLSTVSIPNSVQEALSDPKWKVAMNEEIKSLQKNETWELVDCPPGKKTVGCRWVYTVKYKADGGNLVTWRSKKQNVVACSSAEAEFRGMALGICEALWLRFLLQDLGYQPNQPIQLYCDNKATCGIAHNPVQHDRTKHVKVDRLFIKEKLDEKIIELPKIRSEDQLADILTKAVSKRIFSQVLDKLGIIQFQRGLVLRLLEAISESLALQRDYIDKSLGTHAQHMALNYYPPCPQPELTYGFPGHTDPNVITVLLQDDVPGLQVLRNDKWVAVNPIPNTFIINDYSLNDMVLSNDRYQSVLHRAVVSCDKERISIPTFYCPSPDALIGPAKELIDHNHPAAYTDFTYAEYYEKFWKRGLETECCLDMFKTSTTASSF
ncbi:gibberellin 20 oxidase 3-like [Pistacia vera]|uniref:gibberellin 20 oxidase 3-like n=1 Tax=Pistacia vera TaxID=55513 RepID=UPI001263B3BE|nr:gibberellin 20 oxidase 3-like [Pistacia vera]